MARSDKVPFRREYTFSEDGILTADQGEFVGDILSLHMSFSRPTSYKLEGKVSRDGAWNTLSQGTSLSVDNVDLRPVEYIKLTIVEVDETTSVTLFGYNDDIAKDIIMVTKVGDELDRDIENTNRLTEIRDELRKLNLYMSIITGEDL